MSDDPTRRAPRPHDEDMSTRAVPGRSRRSGTPGEGGPDAAGPPDQTRRQYGPEDAASRAAGEDDPLAALERLQSLGSGQAAEAAPSSAAPAPGARSRQGGGRRPRPRPASRAAGLPLSRLAAPAVFLVAVIVLISLVVHSGVIGGGADQPSATNPTPAATKTKHSTTGGNGGTSGAKATKTYVVKSGDTPSGIADKYSISLSELEDLNPDKDFTTLVVGEKLKVPKQ